MSEDLKYNCKKCDAEIKESDPSVEIMVRVFDTGWEENTRFTVPFCQNCIVSGILLKYNDIIQWRKI